MIHCLDESTDVNGNDQLAWFVSGVDKASIINEEMA